MTENNFEQARAWLREHKTQRLTWGDVDTYIREQHLDDDEYFEMHTVYRHQHPDWKKEFAYADKIRWIAVYWVVGGSEGYYVHVETRELEPQKAELVFLGKFWDVARAELAVNLLQALVNAATW
ncbi:hypothetical protein ARNL5_03348 [Anaerolineae bacterium]|nr:hypothetical protein ARNL5_03348 [Anaerolineae bacterium]